MNYHLKNIFYKYHFEMSIIKNLIFVALLIVLVESKCHKTTNSCSKSTSQTDLTIEKNLSKPFEYGITIDSGESGNRFYLYDIKNIDIKTAFEKENPRQVELLKCTADGSSLHNIRNKEEIRNNFKSCLDKIGSIIPSDKKDFTFIGLGGTSGMRLLSIKNNRRANKILQDTSEVLKETGYAVIPGLVVILMGENEGAHAQFQTNILSNNLKVPVTDPIGLMDMGSGSIQLSYIPDKIDENAILPSPNALVYCPIINYLYITSQDCYGQNEFRFMYYASIIAKHVLANKSTLDINSACLPKNSRVKLSDNFYNSICTIWQFAPSAIKIEKNTLSKYTLVGDGNSEKCRQEIKSLMETRECKNKTCNIQGELQPPVDNIQFKAINGFYYAIDNAKKLLNVNDFTMEEFKNQTDIICSKSLQELAKLNNDNNNGLLDDEFVKRQCFLANYVIETLQNNGFTSFNNIDFVQKVNGANFGWTLSTIILFVGRPMAELIEISANEANNNDDLYIYRPTKENSRALRTIVFLVNL